MSPAPPLTEADVRAEFKAAGALLNGWKVSVRERWGGVTHVHLRRADPIISLVVSIVPVASMDYWGPLGFRLDPAARCGIALCDSWLARMDAWAISLEKK